MRRFIYIIVVLLAGCAGQETPSPASSFADYTIAPDDKTIKFHYGDPLEVDDASCEMNGVRIQEFRQAFRENESATTISGCDRMITWSIPVTYGNSYYGAELKLRRHDKDVLALVCYDEGIGHFEIEEIPEPVSKHRLLVFVADNCSQG